MVDTMEINKDKESGRKEYEKNKKMKVEKEYSAGGRELREGEMKGVRKEGRGRG